MMKVFQRRSYSTLRMCALLLLATLSIGQAFLLGSMPGQQHQHQLHQYIASGETSSSLISSQPFAQQSVRLLQTLLQVQSSDDENSSENNNDNDAINPSNDTVITREMFQRGLLEEPVVKRTKGKKKQGQYKVLDNRDSLPFRVEHMVPDPYTHPETKKKRANKNSVKKRRTGAIEESLTSRVYTGEDEDRTMIGEYMLDKHTTTGDLLEIGDRQYRVSKWCCWSVC